MTIEPEFATQAEAEAWALKAEAKWLKEKNVYQPDTATAEQLDTLRAAFNLEADTPTEDVLKLVHAYEKGVLSALEQKEKDGQRLALSVERSTEKRPTSTLPPLELAERYAILEGYGLDVQGAAQAFRYVSGDLGGASENALPIEALAYDSKADTWRKWGVTTGWTAYNSILSDMTDVVAGLCALEAVTTTQAAPAKLDREYQKLRQRHLASTVKESVRLAQADMAIDKWDADTSKIGLPDARALYITPTHKRPVNTIDQYATDYMTQSMASGPGKTCDLWLGFIKDLTGGDGDLAEGLQVWAASAMLPGNVQHKAHILYGDGGTGKSVFLKVIQAALGDYAGSARASVFVNEGRDHPAELLPFIHKRLVVLPELPRGALRSDLLKVVTGGDSISVRGMRQNPRTETPAATLWFSCNELPSIRMVDNALRRRLMIWPFDNKPAQPDVTLTDKLTAPENLGGVVAWLVDGLKVVVKGEPLTIPAAVLQATESYLNEADTLRQWADACTAPDGETKASDLYHSYVGWCEPLKRQPLSDRSFYHWLSRNYEPRHTRQGSYYPLIIEVQV